MERTLCRICETRRPKRFCPGVGGDICAICCGTEREQSVRCPLDCEYLRESRKHDEPKIVDGATFPNADIRVTEEFLRRQEPLLLWIAAHILRAALEIPGAVDTDLKDALEALVRTYRTMQSGLVYESRPANPIAATLYDRAQAAVEEYRKRIHEAQGMHTVRDADLLGIFAFLQRMEIQQNNGRRYGRAFIDFLRGHFPQKTQPDESPSLII